MLKHGLAREKKLRYKHLPRVLHILRREADVRWYFKSTIERKILAKT